MEFHTGKMVKYILSPIVIILLISVISCVEHKSRIGLVDDTKQQMNKETVIKMAQEAAKNANCNLEDYKKPKAYFELTGKDKTWTVFFNGKRFHPLSHFMVIINDNTGETKVVPGE